MVVFVVDMLPMVALQWFLFLRIGLPPPDNFPYCRLHFPFHNINTHPHLACA